MGMRGREAGAVDGEEVVVAGDLIQSRDGGMKPSRSALATALTCCRLFLIQESLDTVIWTQRRDDLVV